MLKTISAYKARRNLGEILNEVYYSGNIYVVERAGKPMVKVVKILPEKKKETLECIVQNAKQALVKDKSSLSDLIEDLEKNRELFYKSYLRKQGV